MNKFIENRKAIAKEHIAPKLLKRLKIFTIIITIIIGIMIYKIFLGEINLFLTSIGLLTGTIIGLIAGRMFKIHWHTETQKVILQLDKIGTIFLLFFMIVEISRKWFFGHWLQGAVLNAFSLIFLGGLLLGRLLMMIKGIKKVLIEEKNNKYSN